MQTHVWFSRELAEGVIETVIATVYGKKQTVVVTETHVDGDKAMLEIANSHANVPLSMETYKLVRYVIQGFVAGAAFEQKRMKDSFSKVV